MTAPLQSRYQPHPAGRGRWLIRAGVAVNAILFLTMTSLALYYAARNAQVAYFLIVLVVTACVLATAWRFRAVMRRRYTRHSSLGANRQAGGARGHRDPL